VWKPSAEQRNKALKYIGLTVSLALITTAVIILYKKLQNISWKLVGETITNIPTHYLVGAGLAVAAAYATLTLYDYYAVRTIGRDDIAYKHTALASFTSYSIAHNLGATMFTAAVVRYLIYSRYGMTAGEVIKVCFIAGLTFWLGNLTVLGLGFSLEPEAVAPILGNVGLTSGMIQSIGIAMLILLSGYVFMMTRENRTFGKGDWSITLPNWKITSLQILIGIIDLTFCAIAMQLLLPKGIDMIPFRELMVVFVTAMLLGFASHAPGGVGAFEAAMLISLPHLEDETVLAAIILFRLFYFIIPFLLALLIIAAREIFGKDKGGWAGIKASMQEIKGAEADKKTSK
jgi:glycosyltransferase 2 family protein